MAASAMAANDNIVEIPVLVLHYVWGILDFQLAGTVIRVVYSIEVLTVGRR